MDKNTYVARVWYENCAKCQNISIPKGVRIKTIEAEALCPTCGCKLQTK